MKKKQIRLTVDHKDSHFAIEKGVKRFVLITLYEADEETKAYCYATPANLRAIAEACVRAADELEGK